MDIASERRRRLDAALGHIGATQRPAGRASTPAPVVVAPEQPAPENPRIVRIPQELLPTRTPPPPAAPRPEPPPSFEAPVEAPPEAPVEEPLPASEAPIAAPAYIYTPPLVAEEPMLAEDGPFHILLVEDDEAVRDLVTETLNREGYAVTPAASVACAIDLLSRHAFSGYILDYRLEDGDCMEILGTLREQGDLKPAVVIAGMATQDVVTSLAAYGVRDVLEKPFRLGQLRETAATHFTLLQSPSVAAPQELPSGPPEGARERADMSIDLPVAEAAAPETKKRLPLHLSLTLVLLLLASAAAATLLLFS